MKTQPPKSRTASIVWISLGILSVLLLPVRGLAAELSVAYSGSSDQAVIVSFFDGHTEGNSLVGTLQIQNISGTWVYIEQDVTSSPNPVAMPYTIYLFGPDAIKTLPNFTFPQGSYLKLTTTTPLGLDFTQPSEKRTTLQGALAVDLLTRGLLTFSLPPYAFDAPPSAGGVIEPLLDEIVSTVGGVEHLIVAVRDQSFPNILSAISEIASDSKDVQGLLVDVLKPYVTLDQVHTALGVIGELLNLPEKVSLLTDLTARTFAAAPVTWSRLEVVARSQAPSISSASPTVLTTMPVPQTQTLTIHGTGFTSSSGLVFTIGGATYASRPQRLHFLDANTLQYDIAVGSAVGSWTVRLAEGTGSATFQVNASSSSLYTITPLSGPYGSITPNTTLTKAGGESQTFIAIPQDSTFTVDSWYVDGTLIPNTGNRFTLADVQNPHTVFVTFKPISTAAQTGSLTVTLQPAGAISAGAQWQLDGGNYRNSGATVTGLTPGAHTVSCKAVAGYTTPANRSLTITGGAVSSDTETYTSMRASTYTLTVNSDHGGVARNPERATYSSGETVRLIAYPNAGWHFDHWSGDASGTISFTDVVMDRDKTVIANYGLGDWSVGVLSVIIEPPGAVAAGARWRDNGGAWTNSGVTLNNAYIGNHYLEFSDAPPWNKPDARSVTVSGGQTTNVAITYTQDATPGTLVVTLTPPDAVTAGAKWRVKGTQYSSGASVSLAPGSAYTVTFDSAPGWTPPASQTVTIQPGQTTLATGDYTPPAGQPVILSISPGIGALAGGTALTIDGVNFVDPATVLVGDRPATNVTVLSASQIACLTPSNSSYGPVSVVVQTPGGSATNSAGFTYGVPRGTNMEFVSSIGGRIDAVAVNGDYAYAGQGSSFLVLNVSNPESPSLVKRFQIQPPGVIGDIAVFTQSGRTYACVAGRNSGLYVVDVTTPADPVPEGYYKTPGFCYGVAVLGGFAYVADGYAGLQILDLANPSAPALRTSVPQAGFANEIAVRATANGVFAYLSTGGGLRIVEVSDPQAPVVRGYVGFGQWTLNIAVTSTRAYLTTQGNSQMADISNPDNPTSLGQFDSGIAYAIAIQGTTLYCAGLAGFRIQDISTGTPQDIGNLSFLVLTSDGFNMGIANNHAYVAGGEQGLIIVSISTPSTPVRNGSYTVGLGSCQGVAVDGQYAYTACGNGGANIFDVTNPALPQEVKQLSASGAQKVIVNNGLAYVLDNYGKIGIYNISTPSSATLLGTIPTSLIFSWGMSYYGGYLLVSGQDAANYRPEIAVMNISTPSAPSVYTKLELASVVNPAIAVVNNGVKACVAIGNIGEVRILNVSQASNPTQTGQIQHLGAVASLAMTVDGQTLFVGNNGPELCLRIFNISDPSNPTLVCSNYVGGEIRGITLASGKAYLAAGGPGVILMDVENPAAPQFLRSYDTPGYAQQVTVSGDFLYVADSEAGMVVLKLTDMERPEIYITYPTFSSIATNVTGTMDMGGSAADNRGVTRLTWSNSRGGGGEVTGSLDSWFVSGVALQPGTNVLTVTAFDQAGNSGSDTLTVIYQSPKQDQTITFPAIANRTLGDAPVPLAAAASSGLPVSFRVLTGPVSLSNNILSLLGAGAVTVEASQPGNESFNPAPPLDVSFTVAKADQAIAFAALPDKSAGDPPFPLTATASSALPVYFDIVSGPAVLDTNVVTLLGGGLVTVSAWQPGNSNYNAAVTVQHSFNVAKLAQTISFGPLSRQTVGDAPFPLSASASSGLPVSFAVLSGPAVVSGNIVTLTGVGLVTVRASQAGNAAYAAAPDVDQAFAVVRGLNLITDYQRFTNGQFHLIFAGDFSQPYLVELSTNLSNWTPLVTNVVDSLGNLEFTDPSATNRTRSFYRVITQ